MKVIELLSCLAFLAASTSGVEIRCDYDYSGWHPAFDVYLCWGTVTNVENPATVTGISGTHLPGRRNEDVTGFHIYGHQILTKIPKGIENFFANLEGFGWTNGNISSIDSSTFEPFKDLLSIWLDSNKLVTLNGDLFQHTRNLIEISVYENLIQHVGYDLLTGLTDLTDAWFVRNPCIDIWAYNPQLIEELKRQLPIQCPPLATTLDPPTTTISTTNEPNECPDTCTLNGEALEMRKRIDEIEMRLSELE